MSPPPSGRGSIAAGVRSGVPRSEPADRWRIPPRSAPIVMAAASMASSAVTERAFQPDPTSRGNPAWILAWSRSAASWRASARLTSPGEPIAGSPIDAGPTSTGPEPSGAGTLAEAAFEVPAGGGPPQAETTSPTKTSSAIGRVRSQAVMTNLRRPTVPGQDVVLRVLLVEAIWRWSGSIRTSRRCASDILFGNDRLPERAPGRHWTSMSVRATVAVDADARACHSPDRRCPRDAAIAGARADLRVEPQAGPVS